MKYIFFFILINIMLTSCDFSEDIIDENAISEATLAELFEPAITQIAYNQTSITGWGAGALMQYFHHTDASITPFKSYILDSHVASNYWNLGLYTGSLSQAKELQSLGLSQGNDDLISISLILQVKEYLDATTMYGDIPFSEALLGKSHLAPRYDTQESIYQGLISMTDESIMLIGGNKINNEIREVDLVFNGNMELWKKFAYGLRARLHLHLTTKDASFYHEVLSDVSNSFSSGKEQANYVWTQSNTVRNPLYLLEKMRAAFLGVSEEFVSLLTGKKDRRKSLITSFNPDYNVWVYQRDPPFELRWSAMNTSMPLLSYTELCFIKTESLLMTGAADEEVLASLIEAIESSFQQYGLFPDDYQEYVDNQSTFNELLTQEEKLEHIITEAYIAYYGFAFKQSWNNYKRLRIPKLIPTGWPHDFDPSGSVPVRFLYPQTELDLNPVHSKEAIDRQNGALLDEDLWIFKQ